MAGDECTGVAAAAERRRRVDEADVRDAGDRRRQPGVHGRHDVAGLPNEESAGGAVRRHTLASGRHTRTNSTTDLLSTFALQAGGGGSARLAHNAGVLTSPDTLLRLLHALNDDDRKQGTRVLGVDDVALPRSSTGMGTLLIAGACMTPAGPLRAARRPPCRTALTRPSQTAGQHRRRQSPDLLAPRLEPPSEVAGQDDAKWQVRTTAPPWAAESDSSAWWPMLFQDGSRLPSSSPARS